MVSAAGAAEGLGLPAGSRKHCFWGVVGWTSVALTADLWTVKQEMFSLGGNLNSPAKQPYPLYRQKQEHVEGSVRDHSHTAPCSVISSLRGQESQNKKESSAGPPAASDPAPLHVRLRTRPGPMCRED